MINLLPYDEKKKVNQDRLLHLGTIILFSVSIVLFFGVVLMFPAYFNLLGQKNNLEREEEIMRKNAPVETLNKVNAEIKKNGRRIKIILTSQKGESISSTYGKILGARTTGIILSKLSLDKDESGEARILLSGKAVSRESLLGFTKNLEELKIFKKIGSPISNILKKTDVDFSLNLELIK